MFLDKVFSDSFDTFKVFDAIDVAEASLQANNSPKSIWQILNHLIVWQDLQLNKLKGLNTKRIDEQDTWQTNSIVKDQELLNRSIAVFNNQIEQIKAQISLLTSESEHIEEMLKIVQDFSTHLAFHLGEIILQMRQNGHYPMPGEIQVFLNR